MPAMDEIIKKLEKRKTVKIVYGETYDIYGQTLDSLKYYFFAEILHKLLENIGLEATTCIIVGDAHSVKNKNVSNKSHLLSVASERLGFLGKIKSIYNLKLNFLLMTSLMQDINFQNHLKSVTHLFNEFPKYRKVAEKTVLQNRISQEEKAGYQYVLEEVALIIDYDIKIGPPRENNYDKLAYLMGKQLAGTQLSGIYLKPTYPLGMNFDYFVTHPEIEEYGVTPYKAGSNKLQDNRIIIGLTNKDRVKKLIEDSFVPKNPQLPNPVYDIYLISQMAKSIMTDVNFQIDEEIINDPKILKEKSFSELVNYIIKPLQG